MQENNYHVGKEEHEKRWEVVAVKDLPDWLKNSLFIRNWHRPQIPNFKVI